MQKWMNEGLRSRWAMGCINLSWKVLAAVAVIQRFVVVIKFVWKLFQGCFFFLLIFSTKLIKHPEFSKETGVYSVFVGFFTQFCSPSNVCVWSMDTHCVHTQSSLSIFTMLSAAFLSSMHSGVVSGGTTGRGGGVYAPPNLPGDCLAMLSLVSRPHFSQVV